METRGGFKKHKHFTFAYDSETCFFLAHGKQLQASFYAAVTIFSGLRHKISLIFMPPGSVPILNKKNLKATHMRGLL